MTDGGWLIYLDSLLVIEEAAPSGAAFSICL